MLSSEVVGSRVGALGLVDSGRERPVPDRAEVTGVAQPLRVEQRSGHRNTPVWLKGHLLCNPRH